MHVFGASPPLPLQIFADWKPLCWDKISYGTKARKNLPVKVFPNVNLARLTPVIWVEGSDLQQLSTTLLSGKEKLYFWKTFSCELLYQKSLAKNLRFFNVCFFTFYSITLYPILVLFNYFIQLFLTPIPFYWEAQK